MENASFERELEDRLTAIETGSPGTTTVDDLPLRDLLVTVIVLAAMISALMWWAY